MATRIYKELYELFNKNYDLSVKYNIDIEYIEDTLYEFNIIFDNPVYRGVDNENKRIKIKIYITRRYPFTQPDLYYIDPPESIIHNQLINRNNKVCLDILDDWSPATRFINIFEKLIEQIILTTR